MDQNQKRARVSRSATAVATVLAMAALPLVLGCAGNRLPPNPLPGGDGPKAPPAWYPEAPWDAKDGSSQVLIEGKIVFDTDRATIRVGSEKVLDTLLKFLQDHTEVSRLRVEGHTDSMASDEHNQELSARRALSVCDWLVDHGVDHTRLLAVGFGESKPVAPNEVAAGRAENRRTAFHVVELNGSLFQTKDPTAGGYELQVLSAVERKKALPTATAPVAPPPPPPFKPTGDEIRNLEQKGPQLVGPAASSPPNN